MGQSRWADYLGRPSPRLCDHSAAISTVHAGLERRVCESCGHVSIRYLTDVVRIFPDDDAVAVDVSEPVGEETGAGGIFGDAAIERAILCHRCHLEAEFITPVGLACGAHAWGAASMQVARQGEMWIPIHIDHYRD